MEPSVVALVALSLGASSGAVALRADQGTWAGPRKTTQDHAVVGWWGLAASAFLSAAHASLVWAGAIDLALGTTLRLGAVLALVLAAASFIAAAGHAVTASAAVKSALLARRMS